MPNARRYFKACSAHNLAGVRTRKAAMKTIGMIGGMSWESTALYYQIVNREMQRRLGGVHSAKILLYSFDFAEIDVLQRAGRWREATERMTEIGARLRQGGADFLVISCNTMHLMADAVEQAAGIPLLHIADPLGAKIRSDGLSRVGLIGSVFTMEDERILRARLSRDYGVETVVPGKADAAEADRIILEELVCGRFLESSRDRYREIMARLVDQGCQAVILGCTEIPLLVGAEDSSVPLYDTAMLHALAAVERALA
jgi:aspartate racemase